MYIYTAAEDTNNSSITLQPARFMVENGHENDKEETHKDADMPMPSENGDAKTETTETPTETTKTTEEDKETATKRKASESEVEALPVSAEKIAKLKESEVDATKKIEEAAPAATEETA